MTPNSKMAKNDTMSASKGMTKKRRPALSRLASGWGSTDQIYSHCSMTPIERQ
jgi:hypothetical protein